MFGWNIVITEFHYIVETKLYWRKTSSLF